LYGFMGVYATVRDYARLALVRRREAFVSLAHSLGHPRPISAKRLGPSAEVM
jgi:hypothetical protein